MTEGNSLDEVWREYDIAVLDAYTDIERGINVHGALAGLIGRRDMLIAAGRAELEGALRGLLTHHGIPEDEDPAHLLEPWAIAARTLLSSKAQHEEHA